MSVDGVTETWRLEWRRPPLPDCMDAEEAATCLCTGFAFGERGELDLVRARPGAADERLSLTGLFDDQDARLVRWDAAKMSKGTKPDFAALASTPPVHVLAFGDYDHDGRATEFLLQLAAGPCGHTPIAVVGISRKNPHLHAFASVEAPKETFTLDRRADWARLLASSSGSSNVVQIACGDHGADEQTSLALRADGELHAKVTTTRCP